MKLDISEVTITPVKPNMGLVGFASVVLDRQWYLGGIAILTRPQGGYRLVYPTKKVGNKTLPLYHPITKEQSQAVEEVVVNQYEEVTTIDRHDSYYHT